MTKPKGPPAPAYFNAADGEKLTTFFDVDVRTAAELWKFLHAGRPVPEPLPGQLERLASALCAIREGQGATSWNHVDWDADARAAMACAVTCDCETPVEVARFAAHVADAMAEIRKERTTDDANDG